MHRQLDPRAKADDRLNIRVSVWFTVFAMVFACFLAIDWSRHREGQRREETRSEEVSDQAASARGQASLLRPVHQLAFESDASRPDSGDDEALFAPVEEMIQDRHTWMDNPDGAR
jgi:hypothetical protein